jgi:hypothetical protein
MDWVNETDMIEVPVSIISGLSTLHIRHFALLLATALWC